jgi:hypothetical protein
VTRGIECPCGTLKCGQCTGGVIRCIEPSCSRPAVHERASGVYCERHAHFCAKPGCHERVDRNGICPVCDPEMAELFSRGTR